MWLRRSIPNTSERRERQTLCKQYAQECAMIMKIGKLRLPSCSYD
jgi:hypothetical protein